MVEYEMAALLGCIGSSDATHILLEKCSHRLAQVHKGFKFTQTAQSYNIVVNHRHCILHTTDGFPTRWNDKTIQNFDIVMKGLHSGDILLDIEFELLY